MYTLNTSQTYLVTLLRLQNFEDLVRLGLSWVSHDDGVMDCSEKDGGGKKGMTSRWKEHSPTMDDLAKAQGHVD